MSDNLFEILKQCTFSGVNVALRDGVDDTVILDSYYHAYQELNNFEETKGKNFKEFKSCLESKGWDLSFAPLGATGIRYRIDN